MNESQEKVIKLLKRETPKDKLRPWVKGYIPNHFKRLSIDMDEAEELAAIGCAESIAYFGVPLYFTQSVIVGAAVSRKYKHIIVVTPSQYGKSFLLGETAIMLANKNEPVYVAGADTSTTEIIMNKVKDHIQTADESIKSRLIETRDKIERLQTALSKRKLAFKGGGLIEALSLGETFSDSKKGNTAIGRGGNFFIDEASMVSDDTYAELGRSEFATDDGRSYLRIEISNPHNPGRFFDALTDPDPPEGTLIIWIDTLTALEEGRVKSKEQILNSTFFKNKSTCTRYLLCELEDYSEESMFPRPATTSEAPNERDPWYMGVDSAYKGKDEIELMLGQFNSQKGLIYHYHTVIKPEIYIPQGETEWIDGVSDLLIIDYVAKIANSYGVRSMCVDIGFGIWLVAGLIRACPNTKVLGINFGSGTTKVRKDAKHFSAVYGDNKRAEMHLDMQDLMEERNVFFTESIADKLTDQLSAVQCIRKPNGKTAIIPKKEIRKILGRSPDTLDTALLVVHACILDTLGEVIQIYEGEEGATV